MLCRSRGIPCRYVTGYYAHEFNSVGDFLTVRDCDAHAWTEVHLPGKGWTTFDPTPLAPLQAGSQLKQGNIVVLAAEG